MLQKMKAGADALSIFWTCHTLPLYLFFSNTHIHTLMFQLHNVDFTDTDKQCEGSYQSMEHSNTEEEEEDDKEIGEDKKMACVSSESQARGPMYCSRAQCGERKATWAASV